MAPREDHDILSECFIFLTVAPKIMLSSNALLAEEQQNVSIACTATGTPLPSFTWSKSVGSLPEDRTLVMNGTLTIYNVIHL